MDTARFLQEFHDHLAPALDTYEQAIYLYLVRHSRLVGKDEVVVGFKSARTRMALGIGRFRTPMAERICYAKLLSLERKGGIRILATEHGGTRIRVLLPDEIAGLIRSSKVAEAKPSLDERDVFAIPENRLLILNRESRRCFYCLRTITVEAFVVEHVVSRPDGDNTYRNVVAACRQCNNRKGASSAEDFLRILYRESLLTAGEFEDRMRQLQRLRDGQLKPSPV